MEKETYKTDNFQLAAYLLSEGCNILSLDKANPRRAIFIFEETDIRKELTSKFLSYKAETEVHKFFSALKDLKQLIYFKS